MKKNYILNNDGSFVIKDYNQLPPFSNFLPGIAGNWGIPLWVFYVNRGQAIASFGIKDKDQAISEFFSADKAYAFTSRLGFRTFFKINQKIYYEPFQVTSVSGKKEEMIIKSSSLEIKETNNDIGLSLSVKYFTLPNASLAALVRVVSLKNLSEKSINLEVLDGLSRIIPFGSSNSFLKDISRTLQAWMRSYVHNNLALFKLLVDPKDVSHTRYIEGVNFNYSFYMNNNKKEAPQIIIDPGVIFSQDTSLSLPLNFSHKSFKPHLNQIISGCHPCSFSYFKWKLAAGQRRNFYSIFGAAPKPEMIKGIIKNIDQDFLKQKERENEEIIEKIKDNCLCLSSFPQLNQYLKYNYLDNVLRGGYPYLVKPNQKISARNTDSSNIYYIFSRKHGDLERDYNFFQLQPSYFSCGQANYRDINQNRRMDLFFKPALGYNNIVYFLNFLKIDGYNPLIIEGEKLYLNNDKARRILREFKIKDYRLKSLIVRGFYLGEFFKLAEEENIKITEKERLVFELVSQAKRLPQAHHAEGYWIDHWHYNLDLIESFLYFYPDKSKELFLKRSFRFWDDEHKVRNRKSRYILRAKTVYQGESLQVLKEKRENLKKRNNLRNFLRTQNGKVYETNLICKLLTLILNKSATLDPDGLGIEMEAGKPGWCDSLNGLPALFGSSLCETFELKRAALFLLAAIKSLKPEGIKETIIPGEVFSFFDKLSSLLQTFLSTNSKTRDYLWWDRANSLKEEFRNKTYFYLRAREQKLTFRRLQGFLENLIIKLNRGLDKAKDPKSGLYFTYFTYKVSKYIRKNNHILALKFTRKPLPLFLEGIVHALRVEGKKTLHHNLKKSKLFDRKLKMYRLNTSLKDESWEIGRSRVFVPGWLENESIWLHMEYKYLLELLKKGLYKEFFSSFYNCCVCFFNPNQYGRSILENSSFIVSSAYPDRRLWGRGFVARLSGATAEIVNIWVVLCLGQKPFSIDRNNELTIKFQPILEGRMFSKKRKNIIFKEKRVVLEKNTFAFKLFSLTLVVYHNPKRGDTFKDCRVRKIIARRADGQQFIGSGIIKPPLSYQIREEKIERIDIYLH